MGSPAGTASFLLGIGLLAAASDLGAGEGGGSATALVPEVGGDAAVDDGAGGLRPGGLEVDGGGADLGAVEGKDWKSGELRADALTRVRNDGLRFEGFEGGEGFCRGLA